MEIRSGTNKICGTSDDLSDIRDDLNKGMSLLKQVNWSEGGYQLIFLMTKDSGLCLSSHNIMTLRHKSCFLIRAYQIAIRMMRVGVQWIRDCCDPAAKDLNELGIVTAINGETVAKWNTLFCKNEQLPHPNVWARIGKKPKPPIFELFPLLEAEVNEYVMKHLDFFYNQNVTLPCLV